MDVFRDQWVKGTNVKVTTLCLRLTLRVIRCGYTVAGTIQSFNRAKKITKHKRLFSGIMRGLESTNCTSEWLLTILISEVLELKEICYVKC